METYRYEIHCHTKQGSACGRKTGAEVAERYKELGYTGVIITDHFFNGNCAVSPDLPWRERVERFFDGYEDTVANDDFLKFLDELLGDVTVYAEEIEKYSIRDAVVNYSI